MVCRERERYDECMTLGRCLLLGGLAIITGCSDVDPAPGVDAPVSGPPPYTGIWHATGGDLFGTGTGQVRYIELGEDGLGAIRTSYEPFGVLGCGLELFHVDIGGGLVSMDLGVGGARLFRYDNPDADHLVLSDQTNRTLMFERVAEVPAAAKCKEVTPAATTTDIRPTAGYWSGLAFQSSSSLWYADDSGAAHSVNPATGVVTAANAIGSNEWIQTFEGTNYWAHCACGNNSDMALYTPGNGTAVDTLNTGTLGAQVSIYGVTADATALWVAGYSYDSSSYRILKITGAVGARTLADSFDFAQLDGIAAHNGKLWGLSQTGLGTVLVEIDIVTKKAAATYKLPTDIQWGGISAGSGSLWVFGNEPDGDGQLVRITP